jgi:hypothetical protein
MPLSIKDGTGADTSVDTVLNNNVHTPKHILVDGAGNDISDANPIPIDHAPQSGMAIALSRITQFLLAPLGYRKDTQRYQVSAVLESGTVSTVSTVSTVTTVTTAASLTNLGTLSSERLVLNQNFAAWSAVHRARIS